MEEEEEEFEEMENTIMVPGKIKERELANAKRKHEMIEEELFEL